jgi:predicted RNase H-like HicB family nuclease
MKFATTLDRDEDGIWIAECPSIPGCVSQGKTREEAIANIKEAIALCLEVRAERGLPLTSTWIGDIGGLACLRYRAALLVLATRELPDLRWRQWRMILPVV